MPVPTHPVPPPSEIADAFAKDLGFTLEINEAIHQSRLILSATASPVYLLPDRFIRVSRSIQGFENCVAIAHVSDFGQAICRRVAYDTAARLGIPVKRVHDALRSTLEAIMAAAEDDQGLKRKGGAEGERSGDGKRRKRPTEGKKWEHDRYQPNQRKPRAYHHSPAPEASPPPPYSPKSSTWDLADQPIRGLPARPTVQAEMRGMKVDGDEKQAGSALPARLSPSTSSSLHPLPPRPRTDLASRHSRSAESWPAKVAPSGGMAMRAVLEAAAQRNGKGSGTSRKHGRGTDEEGRRE